MAAFADLLLSWSDKLAGLGVEADALERLSAYLERLWAANRERNLVSRKMCAEVLVREHLMDCLIALPYLPRASVVADLGSGGGLPAIPLAILNPETRFLLYEKSPVKCQFLESLRDLAGNVAIMGRIPDQGLPSEVDLVVARAFKPLNTILSMTRVYHRRGGRYLLYKGRRERCLEEIAAAGVAAHLQRLEPVGDAEERHLICLGFEIA